jgi:hypothetical protein
VASPDFGGACAEVLFGFIAGCAAASPGFASVCAEASPDFGAGWLAAAGGALLAWAI